MNTSIRKFDDLLNRKVYEAILDGETQVHLGRIVGGVAWPEVGRPGFLVVLGQELDHDFDAGGRKVHVLEERDEYGGESFLSLESQIQAIRALRTKMHCPDWFGLECPHSRVLADFNRNETSFKRPPVRIKELDDPEFGTLLELVFRSTVVRKLLHFHDSALPGILAALPADAAKSGKFPDHPHVTALLFALAALDTTPQHTATSRTRSVADKIAGY